MKPRHSSNADSDEIMADIAQTRAQMDGTLDELSERLQPRHIIDDILDYFRSHRRSSSGTGEGRRKARRMAGKAAGQMKEKASDAGRVAYQQVKAHPLPTLLIVAGISLLLKERQSNDHDYDYEDEEANDYTQGTVTGYAEIETIEGVGPESYALPQHYTEGQSGSSGMMGKLKGKGSELKGKAGASLQNMKQRTSEKAGALRRRAGEKGAQLREKAHHGYEQSCDTIKRTADERPLMMGLGCLALGVVAGMLIPSTRKEDELVGPTRDRLVHRSREAAEDAVNRGKNVARTAVDVAKQQAQEQGLTPQAFMEKTQAVASQVKQATRDDAQRQQQEFKEELKQS